MRTSAAWFTGGELGRECKFYSRPSAPPSPTHSNRVPSFPKGPGSARDKRNRADALPTRQ